MVSLISRIDLLIVTALTLAVGAGCSDAPKPQGGRAGANLASIAIEPADFHLDEGETVQLRAVATNEKKVEVEGVLVTWSSTDEAVATVDDEGRVRAILAGKAEIHASAHDQVGIASIAVRPVCPPDRADCNGDPADRCEVDLHSSARNCGACGKTCRKTEACMEGICCPSGAAVCEGRCVNLSSDPANCGGCGIACGQGEVCSLGACAEDCAAGLTACGESCVDLTTDPAHCNGCEIACDEGWTCEEGSCIEPCPDGHLRCDGACVDPERSEAHCGGCGQACTEGLACDEGTCVEPCPEGLKRCGDSCVDLERDPEHCGGCEIRCPEGASCDGQCTCPEGMELCDDACRDLSSDLWACGACDTTCLPDWSTKASCVDGDCFKECREGHVDCGDGPCTTNIMNSSPPVQHCGACNSPCPEGHHCRDGECTCLVECNGVCCASSEICGPAGTCIPAPCRRTEFLCGEECCSQGEVCDLGNRCRGSCTFGNPCGNQCCQPGWVCVNGQCDVGCQNPCGNNCCLPGVELCIDGECVFCEPERQCNGVCCPYIETCVDGSCVYVPPGG